MMRRLGAATVCLLIAAILLSTSEPTYLAHGQTGEPRFSYPGARRFAINSYFDHHAPNYTVDNNLTIYTTEVGLDTNGTPDCSWAGTIRVCGYYTESNSGGRRIYYDGPPGIDYAFPFNIPVSAAASGTAYRRNIGDIQVVAIDHGNGYWTRYLHADGPSRVANDTPAERGQQIALSSNTGPQPMAAHLHFEGYYNGEDGILFDPYGWWGLWHSPYDPWNQPFGHTQAWWQSGDPIPMGYRDQNNAPQGPYQLSGVMQDKWESLNGLPGSPLANRGSNNCPGDYSDCQFFERGYVRWDYINSATIWNPYNKTTVSQVFYLPAINWNTTLSITNTGTTAGQVSVLFVENGRVVDSRTYLVLPSGSNWNLSSQVALQDVADKFAGIVEVYSSRLVIVAVIHDPPLHQVALPLILKQEWTCGNDC
jgi:murein DD-endopeptidase MepM/ murein hydrolase activator NlpD